MSLIAAGKQEISMSTSSTLNTTPHLTKDGVAFTVTVDYQRRDCLISREILFDLSRSTDGNLDLLATFYAYHAKIDGIARRLVAAGVQGLPVLLSARNFT
jgi:hypothetical protein